MLDQPDGFALRPVTADNAASMTQIHTKQLNNKLWLVGETMPGCQSVSMTLHTPTGAASEPEDGRGLAAVLSEMLFRGAGDKSAREHSDALDRLGVRRGGSAEVYSGRLAFTLVGEKLAQAWPLFADMAARPTLADEAMPACRDLALQAIDGLQDDPQQRVVYGLKKQHFPEPFGRNPMGDPEFIRQLEPQRVRDFANQCHVPGGSVLGIAGCFDWEQVVELAEQHLGDWAGEMDCPQPRDAAERGHQHEEADTQQVHVALAYDAPPESADDSAMQRLAVACLSGGMSGRLFTEVREKRGLCYAVFASYAAYRDVGAVLGYAGTTTARAQETLDVMREQFDLMKQGVTRDEFDRAQVGLRSRLVMQGESTSARAAAIAGDQFTLGRPRSLEERTEEIARVSLEQLNQWLADNPAPQPTIYTIGSAELTSA